MTANAAQRAAEFGERHAETMAAFASEREALDIERTAPAAGDWPPPAPARAPCSRIHILS